MVSLFILHMFMEAAAPSAASTVAASNESSRESGERRLATVAAAEKTATPEPRAAESGKIHGISWGKLWKFLGIS